MSETLTVEKPQRREKPPDGRRTLRKMISIFPEDSDLLRRLATKTDRSESSVIRQALRLYAQMEDRQR